MVTDSANEDSARGGNVSRFADRVAIITGAAQGIGAATARRLAAEGARVAVVDLTAERAQAEARAARQVAAELRLADAFRKGQGRWSRIRAWSKL